MMFCLSGLSYSKLSIYRQRIMQLIKGSRLTVNLCYFNLESRVFSSFATLTQKKTRPLGLAFRTLATAKTAKLVLGIETSCDDTGAAVVDDKGLVWGESLNSQTRTHVEMGGILPPLARYLHQLHIDGVIKQAMERAKVSLQELDAIAVSVKPGLKLSLSVGLNQAKMLVRESGKPLIPIHHMEAHALTVRMIQNIDFPFLVFLVSGGHCLLAVARDVDDFILLGRGLDDSPGDAFDKTARRLKIKNLPECQGLSGGASIELLARSGDPKAFAFPHVRTHYKDCNFSFSGIKFTAVKIIEKEEKTYDIRGGNILPNVADVCASFQYGVLRVLARRLQRCLLYCELKGLLPQEKTLVVSGGVASNQYLREGLQKVCEMNSCQMVCPPPQLCTDNGIMVAWNGMEKLLVGRGIAEDPEAVDIQARCPLGVDWTEEVPKSLIKLPKLRL